MIKGNNERIISLYWYFQLFPTLIKYQGSKKSFPFFKFKSSLWNVKPKPKEAIYKKIYLIRWFFILIWWIRFYLQWWELKTLVIFGNILAKLCLFDSVNQKVSICNMEINLLIWIGLCILYCILHHCRVLYKFKNLNRKVVFLIYRFTGLHACYIFYLLYNKTRHSYICSL